MSFKNNNFFDIIVLFFDIIVLLCIILFALLKAIVKIKLFLMILFG